MPYQGPSTSGLGPAQILALIGAAAVLISGWLNWFDYDFDIVADSGSAYRVPAGLLLDNTIEDDAGISTGVLIFVAAALIVLGAFLAGVRWLTIVGGLGAVVVAGLYLYQINNLVGQINDQDSSIDASLFDFSTYFPLLALVGGVVAVIGGIMALQRS